MSSRKESPQYVKMSWATAISLGLARGRMYRGAVNRCVNLLVHYEEGCSANCAYCGLAKKRPGSFTDKSFIHVAWPVIETDQIIEAIKNAPSYVKRSCISMITNGKCRQDTLELATRLLADTCLPVSVLLSPTILSESDLVALKDAGVDKVGIALDLATEELFERYRGAGVRGPHRWGRYWATMERALAVFGKGNVGAHLMVGMGETEQEMVTLIERLHAMGVVSHLFSFFAEQGSMLEDRPQPPWPVYLRVQMARYLIEERDAEVGKMVFDEAGSLTDFGFGESEIEAAVFEGKAFMTTGCLGRDGEVACNRPFGNCLPGEMQWNYPYRPDEGECRLILSRLMAR
jgi:biotin synthase